MAASTLRASAKNIADYNKAKDTNVRRANAYIENGVGAFNAYLDDRKMSCDAIKSPISEEEKRPRFFGPLFRK